MKFACVFLNLRLHFDICVQRTHSMSCYGDVGFTDDAVWDWEINLGGSAELNVYIDYRYIIIQ